MLLNLLIYALGRICGSILQLFGRISKVREGTALAESQPPETTPGGQSVLDAESVGERYPNVMLIIEHFQITVPVDVSRLAEALGLKVWEDDSLPAGTAGKLFQDRANGGAKGYSISVRASDPYVRRRFTVAHEIAHFILHRNAIGTLITDDALYRSGLPTTMEAEANRFAADILMPRHLLARYIAQYGVDPTVLASLFKVSEAAMRIRLS